MVKIEKVHKYKSEIAERELKELIEKLSQSGMSIAELQTAVLKGDLLEI